MKKRPKTALVIVNWNKRDDTLRLLRSLITLDYDNYDILVVDNASTDDSVGAIKNQFAETELLVNPENLGGTGGFNSGIKHVLQKGGYEYIWLLDNDAEVEKDTLSELIDAMESDRRIGLAGSRIVHPTSRDITVEAGALVETNRIGVKPLYRNTKDLDVTEATADVDYVAICSALIRTSALEKVGLMDERYFIFWDDMDWGLTFKDKGFKVVCVLNSIAYHEAFTEKRGLLVDYYYGNRNSLLTYSKHKGLWSRIPIFYKYLRQKCTSLVLLGLNGSVNLMTLGFTSLYDFISGRWGKKDGTSKLSSTNSKPGMLPDRARTILILNDGNRDEVYCALDSLKAKYPDAIYTIVINQDRRSYFTDGFQNIIGIDTGKPYSLFYLLYDFVNVVWKNFDFSVSFKNSSPFSYSTVKSYIFDSGSGEFYVTHNNLRSIWKPALSIILGEIMSILLLPVLWASSLKYKQKRTHK